MDCDCRQRFNDTLVFISTLAESLNGTLNKLLAFDKGCTFLVVFGLPGQKHDDDPVRGLRLASRVTAYAEARGVLPQPTIGVTTGRVFCGVVGHADRHEYTIIGDSVNTASRLANLPQAEGKTVCDLPTRCRVAAAGQFDTIGLLDLRGKKRKTKVFIVHPLADTDPIAHVAPSLTSVAALSLPHLSQSASFTTSAADVCESALPSPPPLTASIATTPPSNHKNLKLKLKTKKTKMKEENFKANGKQKAGAARAANGAGAGAGVGVEGGAAAAGAAGSGDDNAGSGDGDASISATPSLFGLLAPSKPNKVACVEQHHSTSCLSSAPPSNATTTATSASKLTTSLSRKMQRGISSSRTLLQNACRSSKRRIVGRTIEFEAIVGDIGLWMRQQHNTAASSSDTTTATRPL